MKITLSKEWIKHLTQLPESGMGYQRVDVVFEDGSTQHNRLVLNAETMDLPEHCKSKTIKDIRIHKKDHPTTP